MRDLLNVNALTDIVSNSVGMLIIFAVLNIAHEAARPLSLEVPLEHGTDRAPAFFIVMDNAVAVLTPELFMDALGLVLGREPEPGEPFDLGQLGLWGETDDNGAFILRPGETLNWQDAATLSDPQGPLRTALDALDPKGQYAYFFVYDTPLATGGADGYAAFRDLRAYLKGRGVLIGWRPVDADHPPLLCFWDNLGLCDQYAPAYSADGAAGP